MAITNSVAIGTGKKKLGEVVLATVKGRTIARKYQPNVANPNTPTQMIQRAKMSNIVILYHALKGILRGAYINRKRYQSAYNAFVSANVGKMPLMKYEKASETLTLSPVIEIKDGQLGELISTIDDAVTTTFDFSSFKNELKIGDVIRAAKYYTGTDELEIHEQPLNGFDIPAGTVNIGWDDPAPGIVLGYIVTQDRKKSSRNKALYY